MDVSMRAPTSREMLEIAKDSPPYILPTQQGELEL